MNLKQRILSGSHLLASLLRSVSGFSWKRHTANLAIIFAFLMGFPHAARPEPPFTATRSADFSVTDDPPLRMPTGVAVGPDGQVVVADGVNDRLVRFDASGRVIDRINVVAGERLSRPVNVAFAPDGQLWIADTGNRRVLVWSINGGAVRSIPLHRGPGDRPPEVTDLAVSRDGKAAWFVDNHNHRLIRHETATDAQTTLGQKGEALGQLNHPFMIALSGDGSALVTDVLNGRVGQYTALGQPTNSVATYGVDVGELYRPKGIECDGKGNIWVSDSVIGVVQVFTAGGLPIDVLRDSGGKPFHFRSPMGLAFGPLAGPGGGDGTLYVVELGANCMVKLNITTGPAAAPKEKSAHAQIIATKARSCTVCHLEWMEPLSNRLPTELIAPPESPPDNPRVSRAETCLSCHDASVVDSRRKVWQEHGHRTGVKPPDTMKVPIALPLVDGKIACRTCHSAHANGQFQQDAATAVFLRAENSAGELCIGCHSDKTRGPKLGTHPTGGMPWAIPQNLIDAGAKIGPNPRELTCTVCHMPHGSVNDHLLVLGTGSNQLCLSCHDQMRPGMFRDPDRTGQSEHPLTPVTNAEQQAAVKQLGTKLGPDDRLICLSCHKLHHGKGERFMLAEELTDGRLCLNCHSEKKGMFDSVHDLRVKFPDERNRLGMTPQSGGPCSACHMFHRYARAPEISEIDPGGGKCITCHQEGRCAATKTLGVANHPKAACVECHDPHKSQALHFLRAPTSELCVTCHSDYRAIDGGPHDHNVASPAWPKEALVQNDRCLTCHRPHGDALTALFRIPPVMTAAAQRDGACIACHPNSDWRADSNLAALHPQTWSKPLPKNELPLVSAESGPEIGCRTCHNPHKPDGKHSKFLRVASGQPTTSLCVACHQDKSPIQVTSHASSNLAAAGLAANSCLPCHDVHALPTAVRERLLWPKTLAPTQDVPIANAYCLSCHRDAGPAKPPAIATHPDVGMVNVVDPGAKNYLPLFGRDGSVDPRGTISCRTCHDPHGHWPDESFAKAQAGEGAREKTRGARLLLRPFAGPNLCTTCHGADALRRFLYFHDPQRRNGPLTDPTAEGSLQMDGDRGT